MAAPPRRGNEERGGERQKPQSLELCVMRRDKPQTTRIVHGELSLPGRELGLLCRPVCTGDQTNEDVRKFLCTWFSSTCGSRVHRGERAPAAAVCFQRQPLLMTS